MDDWLEIYYLSESPSQFVDWNKRKIKCPNMKALDFLLVDRIVDEIIKKYK